MAHWYQTTEGRQSCGMHPSTSSEASSRTKKLGSHSLLRGPDRTPTPKCILCFKKDAVVTAHSHPILCFQKDAVVTAHSYPICGNHTLRNHAHARACTDAQDEVDKETQRRRIWPDANDLARCLLWSKVGGDCRCEHSSHRHCRGHMEREDLLRSHNW